MWRKVEMELPEEIGEMTYSVWTVPGSEVYVGVMRPTAFGPPVLWLKAESLTIGKLKRWREAIEALHDVLIEPALFAECRDDIGRRFLSFLGFEQFNEIEGVSLHSRSA